jgi:hypothetical protein
LIPKSASEVTQVRANFGIEAPGMAFPLKKPVILPLSEERRRFQRVKVNLIGRYMLSDRREYPCQVADMSPGGMALMAPVRGKVSERVIAYVDHVGRLEGVIARLLENGFAMTIAATARKRDKLAAQLTWLANRHILGLPEDRRHGRIAPRNPAGRLILANGVNLVCASSTSPSPAPRLRPTTGLSWDHPLPLERLRVAWYGTSRTASPSSSRGCSIPIFWKTG